jgi:radical SAM protein with 4Fe4S-binding SPASM domain
MGRGSIAKVPSRRAGRIASVRIEVEDDPYPPELPIALQVEFTSHCNLRCRMCPLTTGSSSSSGARGAMTEVVFDELLQIARRCRAVILAGYGEPLTSSQCLPMLRALDAEGIDVAMATNGLLLSPETARQLVSIRHLSMINVSLDSPDPVVYRHVRGGNVERAIDGIRNLMAVVDDPRRVVVSAVAMRSTVPTLDGLPDLLFDLGVQRFSLQSVMDYTPYAEAERLLDHATLAPHVDRIERRCRELGIELEVTVPERLNDDMHDAATARDGFYGTGDWDETRTRVCHVPWQVPFVDKDGRVFACCFAASANERPFGRLGAQTFDELWVDAPARAFRRDLVHGTTTPDVCRRCTVAPLGVHAFAQWAATLVSATVERRGREAIVCVRARNDGDVTWRSEDSVRLGNVQPRDVPSRLAHREWLSPIRAATFVESAVAPGEIATFRFPVTVPVVPHDETFQLVSDGHCWIPATTAVVQLPGRRRTCRELVIAVSRRSNGRVASAARRHVPDLLKRRLVGSGP